MAINSIKESYKEIFKSYDDPDIEKHIKKLMELDDLYPYNSTFFCITNTQDLKFEYISKNMTSCLGFDKSVLKKEGMRYFWNRVHPDDVDHWLSALKSLMEFTLDEIPIDQRRKVSYSWNYRIRKFDETYVNVVQNTTPLEFDTNMKPIIGLAHYTIVSPKVKFQVSASAKVLNENDVYETKYFNNFSQKLLANGITNRERDIVRLLVLDLSSKQISDKLGISFNTVNTHRRNILKKLNISTTGELVGMLKTNNDLI